MVKGAGLKAQSKDKSIRILRREVTPNNATYNRETLYGCMPRYKRIVVLNDQSVSRLIEPDGELFGGWTYNGSLVAYWVQDWPDSGHQVGENAGRLDVYVKNLRTGKTLYFEHADSLNIYVSKLALKPNGSLAYTIDGKSGPNLGAFPNQVRKMDLDGNTVLDSQPGVDPTSLTLSGSTVSWTRSGATFTATIN